MKFKTQDRKSDSRLGFLSYGSTLDWKLLNSDYGLPPEIWHQVELKAVHFKIKTRQNGLKGQHSSRKLELTETFENRIPRLRLGNRNMTNLREL